MRLQKRLEKLAAGLASWFDRDSPRPEDWLRRGWPAGLLLLILPCFVLALSGPIRAATRFPLAASLVVSVLLSFVALVPFLPALRTRSGPLWRLGVGTLVITVSVLFCLQLMLNRSLGHLVSFVGSDGGIHFDNLDEFVHRQFDTYGGFVALYALVHWVQTIFHLNSFWAFNFAFYFQIVLVAMLPCFLALSTLWKSERGEYWVGALACLAASLSAQYFIILPIENYLQADGFFPHGFGLCALLSVWLIDAFVRVRLFRLVGIILAVGIYRYTYALNLGDLFIAVSLLFIWEGFDSKLLATRRWLLFVVGVGLVYPALKVYQGIRAISDVYGWILNYDVAGVFRAELIGGSVLLLICIGSCVRSGSGFGLCRLLRLPALFVLANCAAIFWGIHFPSKESYYLLKHSMHGVVMLGAGAVVACTALSAGAFRSLRTRQTQQAEQQQPARQRGIFLAVSGVLGALLLYSGVGVRQGFESFQPIFLDRAWGKPPFPQLRPLVDIGALRRIEQVLKKEDKQFGGYLVPYGPMYNVMNAAFGFFNGGYFRAVAPPPMNPGSCIFWDEDVRPFGDWATLFSAVRERLVADRAKVCQNYSAHWDPQHLRTLCHRCF